MPTIAGPSKGIMNPWTNQGNTVPYNYKITGQTLNAAGSPLAGCDVHLFYTKLKFGGNPLIDSSDVEVNETTSDASGNFSFYVTEPNAAPSTYFVVAYLSGSPDVAGTTVNTLVGS